MPDRLRGRGGLLVGLPTLDNRRRLAAPLLAALLAVSNLAFPSPEPAEASHSIQTTDDEVIYASLDCFPAAGDYTVTIYGRNWEPNAEVQVQDAFDSGPVGSVLVGAYGTFELDIVITHDVSPHWIEASYTEGGDGDRASIFPDNCAAQIVATPTCATGPTSVSVEGNYFNLSFGESFATQVEILVQDQSENEVGNATVAATESWTAGVTFDGSLPDGVYEIFAEANDGSGNVFSSASTYFVVPCPTIEVTPDCTASGAPPGTFALDVRANGFIFGEPGIQFVVFAGSSPFDVAADAQEFRYSDNPGDDVYSMTPYRRAVGTYTVVAKQGYDEGNGDGDPAASNREWVSASATFTVPCAPAEPLVYVTPDCVPSSDADDYVALQVHGRNFAPNRNVKIVDELWDGFQSEPAVRIGFTDEYGAFTRDISGDVADPESIYFEAANEPAHRISIRYLDDPETEVAYYYVGICQPNIVATPTCGPVGIDSIHVTGDEWAPVAPSGIDFTVTAPSGAEVQTSIEPAASFDEVLDISALAPEAGVWLVEAFQNLSSEGGPFGLTAVTFFVVPCPTIEIEPVCVDNAGGPPDTIAVNVTTSGFIDFASLGLGIPNRIEIVFEGVPEADAPVDPQEWIFDGPPNGTFTITPYARPKGDYRVVAKQGYDVGEAHLSGAANRIWASAVVDFEVPCFGAAQPMLYVTPDCVTTDGETTLEVHGRNFEPNTSVDIWDVFNENSVTVTSSDFGTFVVTLPFELDFDGHSPIAAIYSDDESFTLVAEVVVTMCDARLEVTSACTSAPLSIDVAGSGFVAGSGEFIHLRVLDLSTFEAVGSTSIDPASSFSTTIEFEEFPSGLPDGAYLVTASVQGGVSLLAPAAVDFAETFFVVPCPTVSVQPVCAPAGGPPDEMSLMVTTTGFIDFDDYDTSEFSRIEIVFDNPPTADAEGLHEPQEWILEAPPNGTFTITPFFRPDGVYRIVAKQGYDVGSSDGGAYTHRVWTSAEFDFEVPCPGPVPLDPLLYLSVDCLSSDGPTTIQVHGRNFDRNRDVQVFDLSSQTGASATTSDYGTFDLELAFDHPEGGYHYIVATYVDDPETEVADVVLGECGAAITATPECGSILSSVIVTGTGWSAETGTIQIDMYEIDSFSLVASTTIDETDNFTVTLGFEGTLPDGQYVILAEQEVGETTSMARTFVLVPCPTITIEPVCGPAGGPPDTYSLMITATGFLEFEGVERLEIVFDAGGGEPQEFWAPASNGTFELTPYARPDGLYTVTAKQGYERGSIFAGIALFVFPGATNRQWSQASASFAVPCLPPVTEILISVDCGPPAVDGQEPGFYEITVTGLGWLPGTVDIHFDADEVSGPAQQFASDVNSEGSFSTLITPTQRPIGTYRIEARQHYFEQPIFASAFFTVPCLVIDPVLELDPQCGPPQLLGDEDRTYELTLTGTGYAPGSVLLIFDADAPPEDQQVFEATADESGDFTATVTPLFMPEGEYRIAGRQLFEEGEPVEASVIFFVPCAPPLPELTIDPACGPVVTGDAAGEPAYEINVTGTAFLPGPVDIYFDFAGDLELFAATADQDGSFQTVITPTGRTAGIYDIVAQQEVAFSGTLVEATGVFVVDCEGPLMRVVPGSAPRGLVVRVEGFNFPAETTIDLTWDRGIGSSRPIPTLTDATGTFTKFILIFRSDFTGVRNLTAALPDDPDAFAGVTARHLVLLGTIQPPFETDNPFALPETVIRTRR